MRKPSLLIIFLTVFIDLVGFGIVLPLLPRYSELYGAHGGMIGIIVASYSVMQFLCAPWWGRLSDRIGRRPVILISNAGSTTSYALFALSALPSLSPHAALTMLLSSRLFAGVCGANISVASAYIADITPAEKRSKGMGIIGASFGLGFILGPVIGALSAHFFGLQGPGWTAALLCGSNFALASFILAESRTPDTAPASTRPRLSQWSHTLRRPKVGLLVGLYFLAVFSFSCFESTLPLLLGSSTFHPDDFVKPKELTAQITQGTGPVETQIRGLLEPQALAKLQQATTTSGSQGTRMALYQALNSLLSVTNLDSAGAFKEVSSQGETPPLVPELKHGEELARHNRLYLQETFPDEIKSQTFYYDETRIGYLFAFCGLVTAFVQGGLIGRLVKHFGEVRLIVASLVVVAMGLAFLPSAGTLLWLLVALAVISAASGVNRAPTLGLLSIKTPDAEQGSAMGVAQSAGTLGRIFGPLFATTVFAIYPHAPYLAAAGVCVVAALLASVGLRSRAAEKPSHS